MYLDFVLLTLLLLIYTAICVHALSYKVHFLRSAMQHVHVPSNGIQSYIKPRIILLAICIYAAILFISIQNVTMSLRMMLTVLYAAHMFLFLVSKNGIKRVAMGLLGCGVYILWWLNLGQWNSYIHHIVLLVSFSWCSLIGRYLLRKVPQVTGALVFGWMFYDLYSLWGSSISDGLVQELQTRGVPLWLTVGRYGIGTGDLLFLSLALGYMITKRQIGATILWCVGISLFIFIYGLHHSFAVPLLIFWVPGAVFISQSKYQWFENS